MRPAAGAVVVFLAAAAVLMLEILAARMLAPYVGVSLNTYTGIIGTVLAGIAAGTWTFGQLADKVEPRRMLGPLLIGGGALAMASVPLVKSLGEHVHSDSLKAIVALSGATFFLPAFVLSGVTPVVVKLQLHSLTATGRTVGSLSGMGTFGALVGTFGTGFFLTERVHTRTIALGIGAVLICVGLAVLWWVSPRRSLAVVAAVAVASVAGGVASARVQAPCLTESAYFCINVYGTPRVPLLELDSLPHSSVHLDDPAQLDFDYARIIASAINARWPAGRPLRTLHVGGGAFTLPLYLAATRPGSFNKVLEIDPAVVDTAHDRFGVRASPLMQIKEGDARVSLRAEPLHSYDLIIGDAFSSRSVPWHLTTEEFLAQLHRRLRPGGAYMMNLIDAGDRFARAETATMRRVFPYVVVVPFHNYVLIGADRPLAVRGLRGAALDRFVGDAQVLTDDFAPVDQLLK